MGVKHEYKMHIKFALRSSKIQYVKYTRTFWIGFQKGAYYLRFLDFQTCPLGLDLISAWPTQGRSCYNEATGLLDGRDRRSVLVCIWVKFVHSLYIGSEWWSAPGPPLQLYKVYRLLWHHAVLPRPLAADIYDPAIILAFIQACVISCSRCGVVYHTLWRRP